jgi:cell division GTPase FtsZ
LAILFFGAGGGSGSGLAPGIIDLLNEAGIMVGIGMTFPAKDADLVENRNAIHTLNQMESRKNKIKPYVMIDNEYIINRIEDRNRNYWEIVNNDIVNSFFAINSSSCLTDRCFFSISLQHF